MTYFEFKTYFGLNWVRSFAFLLAATAVSARGQVALTMRPDTAFCARSAASGAMTTPGQVTCRIFATLLLTNQGQRPALLLTDEPATIPTLALGDSEVFTPNDAVLLQDTEPEPASTTDWPKLATKLTAMTVKDSGLTVIPPGESMVFHRQLVFIVPESMAQPARNKASLQDLQKRDLWFSARLSVWPEKLEQATPGQSVSAKVKQARQADGDLLTEEMWAIPAKLKLDTSAIR